MASVIPKAPTVAALGEVWASIADLAAGLDDESWALPSPLPGWSVQDNVSHMVGTEAMLLGHPTPEVAIDREALPHVTNEIGDFNEVWVEHLRTEAPAAVLARFREYTGARLDALRAMPQDEWAAESFTPAGKDTYGRFMQLRVFDCWLHEQDIRDTVGAPGYESGGAVDVMLDEMTTALGFVVGKRAAVGPGNSVEFVLTDADSVVRRIAVDVAERAAVVDSLPGEPTVRLTMPVGTMTRLCAGRVEPESLRSTIEVEGDEVVGDTIAANLRYTI